MVTRWGLLDGVRIFTDQQCCTHEKEVRSQFSKDCICGGELNADFHNWGLPESFVLELGNSTIFYLKNKFYICSKVDRSWTLERRRWLLLCHCLTSVCLCARMSSSSKGSDWLLLSIWLHYLVMISYSFGLNFSLVLIEMLLGCILLCVVQKYSCINFERVALWLFDSNLPKLE